MIKAVTRVAVALACAGVIGLPVPVATASNATSAAPPAASAAPGKVPVFAYFYQWFSPSSWRRAKVDYPLAGNYSSDDPRVLRQQIEQARAAGIDGFITSWKDTPQLDHRLQLLLTIAASEHFQVGTVYQALDFSRKPLPITQVRTEMTHLVENWGGSLRLLPFGRPVIIWTGTDLYSVADVRSVREALGNRAYLLAASKTVAGYERVAGVVDGEAYYWSSADPRSPDTLAKLNAMSASVHRHGGIWLAPAAPGFDGRTLAHSRVIPRDGGSTFRLSLEQAYASRPDAVGVISWNEWSENTYIEPGRKYGAQELNVLRDYLNVEAAAAGSGALSPGPSTPGARHPLIRQSRGGWSGFTAALVLAAVCGVGLVVLLTLPGRRRGQRPGGGAHSLYTKQLSNTRN